MTQYNEAVEQQQQLLDEEKFKSQIVSIDTRFDNGLWTQQTIRYADGKEVTEFRDSRKKSLEEQHDKEQNNRGQGK